MAVPTERQAERLKLAIVAKAVRFLRLPTAPFGSVGEVSEWGQTTVRPDFNVSELLTGLRYKDLSLDGIEVTPQDVIHMALNGDDESYSESQLADIQTAIDAATDFVAEALAGFGFR